MGAVEAVRAALSRYATFSGRARRSEFWWFALFTFIVSQLASGVDKAVFGTSWLDTGPIGLVVALVFLVPSLAVSWRRLHDTGRSGAWTLIGLIPLLGTIMLVIFDVQDSTDGPNRFGPSPKPFLPPVGYGPGAGYTQA